jgi:hypothetical protein
MACVPTVRIGADFPTEKNVFNEITYTTRKDIERNIRVLSTKVISQSIRLFGFIFGTEPPWGCRSARRASGW